MEAWGEGDYIVILLVLLSYSKPKVTWNNAFSVSNQNVKTLN